LSVVRRILESQSSGDEEPETQKGMRKARPGHP
jgi:hypothetical protein